MRLTPKRPETSSRCCIDLAFFELCTSEQHSLVKESIKLQETFKEAFASLYMCFVHILEGSLLQVRFGQHPKGLARLRLESWKNIQTENPDSPCTAGIYRVRISIVVDGSRSINDL